LESIVPTNMELRSNPGIRVRRVGLAPPTAVLTLAFAVAAGARGSTPAASIEPGWTASAVADIDAHVFQLAVGAAQCAVRAGKVSDPATLTVIDYSKPSTSPRLWVFDLHARELLYEELVAHGQGSGENLATLFSNDTDTHRSSLGLFVTGDTYVG